MLKKTKTLIIAEVGVNHNGKITYAKKLIDGAASAGADYVKFQTYDPDLLVSKEAKLADYQKKNIKTKSSQFKMLKKLQLSEKGHLILYKYARKKKIKFLSSGFDIKSLDLLSKLNLDFFKIPSSEINNVPYLRHIAKFKKKTIMSTGLCSLKDIKFSLNILIKSGLPKNKIFLLQCNSEYPSPIKDSNIRAMLGIKKLFRVNIGYSDHTQGIESSLCAVALGAKIIEKHITLNKKLSGPDHAASADLKDFKFFVQKIRNLELSLGKSKKVITKSEIKNLKNVRKYLFAKVSIQKGEKFMEKNLLPLRGNTGIPVKNWDKIIGRKSKYDFKKYELIKN